MSAMRPPQSHEGRFITLEPLTRELIPELYAAIGHPAVFEGGYGGGPAGYRDTLEGFTELAERYYGWDTANVHAVRLKGGPHDGLLVGTSTLGDFNLAKEFAHLGWTAYDPRVWGTAVNVEAKLLILGSAFDNGFRRVKIQADSLNGRSRAAIAKLGATFEGLARQDRRRADGSWGDTAVFSVVASDWPSVRAGLIARLDAFGQAPVQLREPVAAPRLAPDEVPPQAQDTPAQLWIGCYGPDSGGAGAGIRAAVADETGALRPVDPSVQAAAALPSPSFVARHPSLDVIYTVTEFEGGLHAFGVDAARLDPLGQPRELGGGGPCHIAVSPDGAFLVVCCYGSGEVVVCALDAVGALSGDVSVHAAPAGDPEAPPHAHSAVFLPDGRVATADLGRDLVLVWRTVVTDDGRTDLEPDHEVALATGSGPRHFRLHPSGVLYVVTEYSIEVAVLALDQPGGRYELRAVVPATASGRLEGDGAAEITAGADFRWLHVSVRGSDRISTLSVSPDGLRLEAVADTRAGGSWPRHHAERGLVLHVADQRSDEIVTFALDAETGIPLRELGRLSTGAPTCIA